VAAAIARAAGPQLDEDGRRIVQRHGPVPTGSAVLTSAGKLPFKGVIHAVGPQLGQGDEENMLISALITAFTIADTQGWQSLSFPAVSAGVFAVPAEICAKGYVAAAREFFASQPDSKLKTLRLCLFPGPVADAVVRWIKNAK
jgi:O-acetyl-ADP-ribose deacetylase (regulator of RNase III)